MKRIFYLISLLLGICLNAEAQNIEANNWNFGLRAGICAANQDGDIDDTDPILNFHVGGAVSYAFTSHFYIESGLSFSRKGCHTEESASAKSNLLSTGISGKLEETNNLYYLQVPILASYRFTFSNELGLNLQAEPYLAYGIAGKCKWETSGDVKILGINTGGKDEGDFDSFDDDRYNKFDTGVKISAGLQYNACSFSLGCEHSVINIFDNDDYDVYNNVLTFTFGYDF